VQRREADDLGRIGHVVDGFEQVVQAARRLTQKKARPTSPLSLK
jgi:hypothetical protein